MPQENVSQNFNELFGSALALQQEKKWDEALASYQKLLDQSRESLTAQQASVIYHNMSVIAFAKNDSLRAYVWSKKALHLNPANSQAREAFENYAKKVEVPSIPHQISGEDQLQKVISVVPVDVWLVSTIALLLFTVWIFLKYFIKVKKNKINGVFKKPPLWHGYILILVTAVFAAACFIGVKESRKQMAVVVAEKAPIQTVPGENKAVIFEAQSGMELEVLAADSNYFQVRYPGAFTGWVNKDQVELLSLSFRQ
jgi:tetratricopeptide (TPR) repeat protein